MTYANVVYSYDSERFIRTAAEIGMDGLILPDVPFEEKAEFDPLCRQYGIDLVSPIALTPAMTASVRFLASFRSCVLRVLAGCYRRALEHHHRHRRNGEAGQGDAGHPVRGRLRHFHHEQARERRGRPVTGAIVGSAIVKICAKYGKDCVPHVKEYVRSMKTAVQSAN